MTIMIEFDWDDFFASYDDKFKPVVLMLVTQYLKTNNLSIDDLKDNAAHINEIRKLVDWHFLQLEVDSSYGKTIYTTAKN